MRRYPWYKRDVDAWRGGTRSMSMELRGFYSECLDAMWDLQGPIPADEARLAVMLCCNPRTVRKLLPQLGALGKLVQTADGYINPRMMSDMRWEPVQRESEPNSTPIRVEFESKVPKNPMFSTRELEKKEEREEDSPLARGRRAQVWIDKGRVRIGPELATEIAETFPHARVDEVAISAARKLIDAGRLSPDEMVAVVLERAMWNNRDNSRGQPGFRAPAPGQRSALEIIRSMA